MPLIHEVQKIRTADGVEGLLVDVPGAPIFHYEIFFRGGYHGVADEPQQTAHVLEHMVASATADPRYREKDAYLNDLYKNGAYTNAATYYAGIWYYADCSVDEWKRMLRLQRLAIEQPLLTDDTLKAEVGNAAGEMKRNINLYSRLATELAKSALGLETLTSAEHVESFATVTLAGIQSHYDRTHTLENMQFIVTGDIQGRRDDIIAELSGWNLRDGTRIKAKSLIPKTGGSYVYKKIDDLPSIYVNLTCVVNRRLSLLEAQAFELINSYLFNVLNSKVYGEVRRRGLAYELHGYLDQDIADHSLWIIWAPIPAENIGAVLELVLAALRQLTNDLIDEDRFAYSKTYVTGRTQQYGQTVATLTDLYSSAYSIDKTVASYDDLPGLFEKVTPELVRELVREIVATGIWTLAGVGSVTEDEFKRHYQVCKSFFDEVK